MARRAPKDDSSKFVKDYSIAPHRYDKIWIPPSDYSEWKKHRPYNPGEVVFTDDCGVLKKAKIIWVFRDYDMNGFPREKYKVKLETQKGEWAKNFVYIFPGWIQRGYVMAKLTKGDSHHG